MFAILNFQNVSRVQASCIMHLQSANGGAGSEVSALVDKLSWLHRYEDISVRGLADVDVALDERGWVTRKRREAAPRNLPRLCRTAFRKQFIDTNIDLIIYQKLEYHKRWHLFS